MTNKCIESVTHPQIVCKENQSKFILLNPTNLTVDKITVDGCIYPRGTNNKKCDFALNFDNTTILIELKGSKLKDACTQILAVIEQPKFTMNHIKHAVIVTRRTPRDDTTVNYLKDNLRKKGIKLLNGNSPIEKNIVDFR
jgi:hypothetical protein